MTAELALLTMLTLARPSAPVGQGGIAQLDQRVVAVTSLANEGPGTLRAAIRGAQHARVVFAVGGAVHLRRPIVIRDQSSITVDGASAPAPGITLRGHGIVVSGSRDVVLRHLRVRDAAGDGVAIKRSRRVVVEHCSLTNAKDENLSVVHDSDDITVSWTLLGFAPTAPAGNGKGMLVASFDSPPVTNVSIHHNLFVNNVQRSPQISTPGAFVIRNNVIANWQAYGVRIRNGARGDVVGNVFSTVRHPERALVLAEDAGPVHVARNVGPGDWDVNALSTAPASLAEFAGPSETPEEVERRVLARAGALPRDAHDAKLVPATLAARR